MEFEPVIGLEVHAQLRTGTKLFCGCPANFGDPPNTNVCPVCLGHPGVLPVLNQHAVELALRAALALRCEIPELSRFDRKNYFYPDLPKGYQISQFHHPLGVRGYLDVPDNEKEPSAGATRIRVTRIHMEEDAGKLVHEEQIAIDRAGGSMADYNRAGLPLVEIVSEPDITSPQQAGSYMRAMRQVLRYVGACDGDMEKGNLRCDANVSIRPKGQKAFGTKVELKNINSFRFVERAITFEIERQKEVLLRGGNVAHETRLFDSAAGVTRSMRSKEMAHDYRYFPDPDLVPIRITAAERARYEAGMEELPLEKAQRFVEQYGLSAQHAGVLTSELEYAQYFEQAVTLHGQPQVVSNWIQAELLREIKNDPRQPPILGCPVPPAHLAGLLDLIGNNTISGKTAKDVLVEMYQSGATAGEIVERRGLKQVSDTGAIERALRDVMDANPGQVEAYRGGKTKLFGFFVGQAMKKMAGQANPAVVNDIAKKLLDG